MTENEMLAQIEFLNAQLAQSKAQLAQSEAKVAELEAKKMHRQDDHPAAANPGALFESYVGNACKNDDEAKRNLRNDVAALWTRLGGFADKNAGRAYGLAVGRVQSGKTRNYIGLMFKAIENGFNTFVILTSKNKRLAYQTHKRVEDLVNDAKMCVRNRNWLTAAEDDQSVSWRGGSFVPDGVNVAVVLKNESGHLAELKSWLAKVSKDHGGLKQMRLLFIDDESDSATPNTNSAIEPGIGSKSDIVHLAETVERASEDPARHEVGKWLREFSERKFDDQTSERLCKLLVAADLSMKSFMELMRDNAEVASALGLDREVSPQGSTFTEKLSQAVYDVFNRDGRRRSPNWLDLHDVLAYAFDLVPDRSRINASICAIVGASAETDAVLDFGQMAYVAYTATPFANMLNEDPKQDPLCPDFIVPLTVSSRYFGLDRIFGGSSGVSAESCQMKIVRTIPQDEYAGWVKPMQDCAVGEDCATGKLIRDHNFAEEGQQEDVRPVEWTTLKAAVMWAFCTAAARRVVRKRGSQPADDRIGDTSERWTTMLFNLSHLSDQEKGVHVTQQKLLDAYLAPLKADENYRNGFIEGCMRLWHQETNSAFTKGQFLDACLGYGEPTDYPDAQSVERELRDWFLSKEGKVRVVQMNSKTLDDSAKEYYDKECTEGDVLWIVCGGNAISRGLTLEGLTVSYYDRVRRGSAVDSITQMGRWFGYRNGYELLPRIWMTEESIGVMKDICRTENQLHEALREQAEAEDPRSIRQGRDVTMIRFFGRRLTSRDANSERLDGANSYGVFNCVLEDSRSSIEVTEKFISNLGVENVCERTQADGYSDELHRRHRYYWRGVNADRIATYLMEMRDAAFCDASRQSAAGLGREASTFIGVKWNVVIDSPLGGTDAKCVQGIRCVENIALRNYQGIKVPEGIRLGHAALPGEAFLSGVPSRYVSIGKQSPTDRLSDLKVLGRVFDAVTKARDEATVVTGKAALESMLNPVLAISFVRGPENRTYVLLSFYWHGHQAESYVRAIVSPDVVKVLPKEMIGMMTDAVSSVLEKEFFLNRYLLKSQVILKLSEKLTTPEFNESEFNEALTHANAHHLSFASGDGKLLSDIWCSPKWLAEMMEKCTSDGECVRRQLETEARILLERGCRTSLNRAFLNEYPNRGGVVWGDNFDEFFMLGLNDWLSRIRYDNEHGWDVRKECPTPCDLLEEAVAFEGKQYWLVDEPEMDDEDRMVCRAVADDASCDGHGGYPCVKLVFEGTGWERGDVLSVEATDETYVWDESTREE